MTYKNVTDVTIEQMTRVTDNLFLGLTDQPSATTSTATLTSVPPRTYIGNNSELTGGIGC
ncbi:hypothetical protein [Scytonema sp. PRP1]|uniref:hypothetical protein n=1 Tax=Scytonema sp. PRP1 TaxID=3120513 RepID=UPI00300D4F44